jgi:transcriptional regulator with XRE-family HTH domain
VAQQAGSAAISSLRVARHEKKLSISELANKTGFDASYISLVETAKKNPSDRFLIAYARALELPEDYFVSTAAGPDRSESKALPILDLFKGFSLYNSSSANSEFFQIKKRLGNNSVASVADRASKIFLDALNKKRSDRTQQLISIRSSRGSYPSFDQDILNCYGPLSCETKTPLWILFRPNINSNIAHEYLSDVMFALEYQLPFINDNMVFVESTRDMQPGIFPIDFHLALPDAGIIAVGNGPFQISDWIDIGGDDVQKFLGFFEMIKSYRDRKIVLFRHEKFMQFSEEYVKLESHKQRRYMAQRFLGGYSRPPSDFQPGTSWWTHYSGLEDRGLIDIERLAEHRLQMDRLSRDRMIYSSSRQICSREAVESWARAARRTDKPDNANWFENKKDRYARLDYLRYLLERSPAFELAAIDDNDGTELGWSTTNDVRDLNWVVEGRIGVIFETTYDQPRKQPWRELQCVVQSEIIADEFASLFDSVWNRLPSKTRDRASILEWIAYLRKAVQEAPR